MIYGQPLTVMLERRLISYFLKLSTFCVLLVTAVKDLFSGRLPGRSQDLGTFFNFHICNSRPCHFRVGDILIFNLDQMIFSLWSILLYYWQNIITCGFLSFFQANKGVCGFWGEIVHITWTTWPCAHCAVFEVWHRATWVSWNMWNISMLSRPSFFSSLAPIFLMFLSGEVSWMCQSGDFQVNLIFESDKATICAKSHTWQGFCFDQGLLRWQPFLWQCDLSKRGLCLKEMYEIMLHEVFFCAKRVKCRLLLLLVIWTLSYH